MSNAKTIEFASEEDCVLALGWFQVFVARNIPDWPAPPNEVIDLAGATVRVGPIRMQILERSAEILRQCATLHKERYELAPDLENGPPQMLDQMYISEQEFKQRQLWLEAAAGLLEKRVR